jgi:hypothetical protein
MARSSNDTRRPVLVAGTDGCVPTGAEASGHTRLSTAEAATASAFRRPRVDFDTKAPAQTALREVVRVVMADVNVHGSRSVSNYWRFDAVKPV